jgi:hypothetical protein
MLNLEEELVRIVDQRTRSIQKFIEEMTTIRSGGVAWGITVEVLQTSHIWEFWSTKEWGLSKSQSPKYIWVINRKEHVSADL